MYKKYNLINIKQNDKIMSLFWGDVVHTQEKKENVFHSFQKTVNPMVYLTR